MPRFGREPKFDYKLTEGEDGRVVASATIRRNTPQGGAEDGIAGITGSKREVLRRLAQWRRSILSRIG